MMDACLTTTKEKSKILIVDDDQAVLRQLSWALSDSYDVSCASSSQEALKMIKEGGFSLITLDINLVPQNSQIKEGLEILAEIKNHDPLIKVIMITADDAKDTARAAIERGAFDYYVKPINLDELKIILKRADHIRELEVENKRLALQLDQAVGFEDIIGSSDEMEKMFKMIRRIAPTDATVLVRGESGTGKELVARAIHYSSLRKDKPFVVINCGAIPENLLESELFGHERGAFTDAHIRRQGKLEAGNGGTVFLDEIGEMSLNLQVKILRFLQERVIERVGANTPRELDVRIIVATNADLEARIKQGSFRQDLYYRLSVISLRLPSLRERGDDILLLANYFLGKFRAELAGKDIKGFSKEAKDFMRAYTWPGNVREMENRVKRAVILAENSFIKPDEMGFGVDIGQDESVEKFSLKKARRKLETKLIKQALLETGQNISLTAKMLGVTRPTLYDLVKKYNIET